MKRRLLCVLVLLLSVFVHGCADGQDGIQPAEEKPPAGTPQATAPGASGESAGETGSIVYKNTQYGFRFSLPESWKGYVIVADKWEGLAPRGPQGETASDTGPMISIRHPQWTSQDPRQDIPIMVFTLAQWESLQQGKYHIAAAPIGPSELGRNSEYVFALPARYNFAFPTGFEEVEHILKGHPLQASEEIQPGTQ
ncbi:MAG: hypothetical protein ACM3X4_09450 [Ignavibacteriales bacterium]